MQSIWLTKVITKQNVSTFFHKIELYIVHLIFGPDRNSLFSFDELKHRDAIREETNFFPSESALLYCHGQTSDILTQRLFL